MLVKCKKEVQAASTASLSITPVKITEHEDAIDTILFKCNKEVQAVSIQMSTPFNERAKPDVEGYFAFPRHVAKSTMRVAEILYNSLNLQFTQCCPSLLLTLSRAAKLHAQYSVVGGCDSVAVKGGRVFKRSLLIHF